ncbi:MAG: hypothetical protein WBQ08_09835 [Candidatus Sulfotelmatobacter sp.]
MLQAVGAQESCTLQALRQHSAFQPASIPAPDLFEQKRPTNHSADQERIAYLQKKIQTKDEVLAELMAEHVALEKDIGEL